MPTPEILKLVASGKLHEFDAEWIGRLPPQNQLAAARKCMRNFGMTPAREDNPKSRINIPSRMTRYDYS